MEIYHWGQILSGPTATAPLQRMFCCLVLGNNPCYSSTTALSTQLLRQGLSAVTGAAVSVPLREMLCTHCWEKSRGCMEAMISWESSSVFTASARLATPVKSKRGCKSQEQSGRERRCFGGRESFTPGSRGRGGRSYCCCVLQVLCAAMSP